MRPRTEVVAGWSDFELVARIRQHTHDCADCDEVKLVAREIVRRMAQTARRCRELEVWRCEHSPKCADSACSHNPAMRRWIDSGSR